MRRAIPLIAAASALFAAGAASGQPRVRAGTIPLLQPARVQVVVALPLPPLALAGGRSVTSTAVVRRTLNVRTSESRAYLQRIATAQAEAIRTLRRAIPQATVGRRFQVVLDALTVSLPATQLPTLLAQPWAADVYPSVSYEQRANRSPSIIGADALRASTGADGAGIKIAIVDDGIDQTNAFFDPAGFGPVPPGFPKGITSATNAKVIVARAFPGPGAGAAGKLPVDPDSSFHGTHVAGIAAGVAGTTAPAGGDHPRVTGLSGVAPRAFLGNYRVFTVPTPIGHVANTPEIIAAFEAAVEDGMDIVNFSGGGPQIDPRSDALVAAVRSLAAAGVVPVIAAGNDRDEFGLGSVGSPGTAPDAIAVAAVSNLHVFAPPLDVTAPGGPKGIAFVGANGERPPVAWGSDDRTLIDVASITGTDGTPVDRHLCGPDGERDRARNPIPVGSLNGAVALVQRGLCPFSTKAAIARVSGAVGIVVIDNREGEANQIPEALSIPGGAIAKADGARLLDYLGARGGRAPIRVGREPVEIETGRSAVVTAFSSGGPTAFGHELKPDLAAPGGAILSSTLPRIDASGFAVFDGTSMAAPHVAGAAAQLLQLHPTWTPAQIKSALMSTAVAAYGDSFRTREAAVPLEGAGLASLPRANDPQIFTSPQSLSLGDLAPAASARQFVQVTDAGDGSGLWSVTVVPQVGTPVVASGVAVVPPGGATQIDVTARAATAGENYGFVQLQSGDVTRRIPYFFFGDAPALAAATAVQLKTTQTGTTARGTNRVTVYRYPLAPFGNRPDEPVQNEDGAETVYVTTLRAKAVNAGVSILGQSDGARIDTWYLARQDENTVQGFTGTPVGVNELTYDYLQPIGAAGVAFPQPGTYYVSVDSGRGQFDDRRLAGRYTLRSWVDDVRPPAVQPLTTRVTAGRPTLAFRATDAQSGVDPASLTVGYQGVLVGAGSFDRATGIATFPLPASVPALRAGTVRVRLMASDFQEAKNVDTSGRTIMPNTRTTSVRVSVVAETTVSWVRVSCRRLTVVAGSPRRVVAVRFSVDGRRVATDRSGSQGLWSSAVRIARGKHTIVATAVDAKGHAASARRTVRSCSG